MQYSAWISFSRHQYLGCLGVIVGICQLLVLHCRQSLVLKNPVDGFIQYRLHVEFFFNGVAECFQI